MKQWRVTVPYDEDPVFDDHYWFDTKDEAKSFAGNDPKSKVEEIEVIEFYGAVSKTLVEYESDGFGLTESVFSNIIGLSELASFNASDNYRTARWKAMRREWGESATST